MGLVTVTKVVVSFVNANKKIVIFSFYNISQPFILEIPFSGYKKMAYHFVLLEMESCSVHANPIMKDHFVMNARRASLIIQNVNVSTKYLFT